MKSGKGRNRTGSLYRRYQRKKYSVDDPKAKGKGVIWLRYTVAGRRHDESLKTSSLTEAKKKQAQIMRPIELGNEEDVLLQQGLRLKKTQQEIKKYDESINPPLTLEEGWDTYISSPERPDTGRDTLKYYEGYWNKFKCWVDASHPNNKQLRDITPKTAQDYAVELNRGEVSPNTYNKHIGFLTLFFRVLEELAAMNENPFERIRKKKLKTNVRRELTIAELKEILETASDELQTLLYLGTFTGLRLGDCCTLIWGEVDLDRQLIKRVPNKTAKSGKPVLIGIPDALHEKLSEAPKTKRKGYVLPRFADLYAYRSATGKPTRQPNISNEIQKVFADCGIRTVKEGTGKDEHEAAVEKWEVGGKKGARPICKRAVVEVGFHSLRHTYVSLHADAGTPQAMIQANVGHGNPAMTAHYTHIGESAAVKAAGVLDIGLDGTESEEPTPEPFPPWVGEKAKELMGLTEKITGKKNGQVAEAMRDILEQLIP